MEIERKWLLSSLPKENLKMIRHYNVEQLYLAITPEIEIRIRKMIPASGFIPLHPEDCGGYLMTVKNNGTLSREEVEIEISEFFYEDLKNKFIKDKKPIIKDYYVYDLLDGHFLECSVVDKAWIYAEIEFSSEKEAKDYKLSLSTLMDEITDDSQFKMKNYWRNQNK